MKQSDRDGGGRVPDEELAEIARQLRDVLGTGQLGHARPDAPIVPPPAREARRPEPATIVLRFFGGFILPGLVLIAIALLGGLAR